jgi:hypothetical protein
MNSLHNESTHHGGMESGILVEPRVRHCWDSSIGIEGVDHPCIKYCVALVPADSAGLETIASACVIPFAQYHRATEELSGSPPAR